MADAGRPASLVAILSACSAFALGMGLTLPLLSLILERRGFAGSVNGFNLATSGLAALCVTPQVPRLMRTFGTAAFMSGSLVLSAIALVALFEVQSLWAWFPLRFAVSIGLNGLFVCSEFWINQIATEQNRGRYISLYGACISGGFGVGPAILSWLGTYGLAPFAMGSTMLLFALVPVLIARKAAPQLDETPGPSPLTVLRLAPAILPAAFVFGFTFLARAAFLGLAASALLLLGPLGPDIVVTSYLHGTRLRRFRRVLGYRQVYRHFCSMQSPPPLP